jgi:hypothetical protein
MASEKAPKLADTILDDFRGAGFYANPKELTTDLKGVAGRTDVNEGTAIKILRGLLRMYGQTGSEVKSQLADQLELYLRN